MSENSSKMPMGIQMHPNPGRNLVVEHKGLEYARYPVRTHLVQIGENYMDVIKKYAAESVKEGDILAVSEKFIGICQERVVHQSEVNPGWLAKLIVKFTKKYPDDVGWENPRKMQVAINEAGWLKMIVAVIVGGIMKYVFRKTGVFYEILGRDIAAIDGFSHHTISPFDEYATLAPSNPDGVAAEIEEELGVAAAIVDASNVAVHTLGTGPMIVTKHGFEAEDISELLAGNPMGQGREQTPIIIVRATG